MHAGIGKTRVLSDYTHYTGHYLHLTETEIKTLNQALLLETVEALLGERF